MSVKRFLGVELDGFVECAEGFLNASGLSGLQGNGAEMNGEVIEGGGILGIGFESLFPLINSPLTVVDVREETAVGNALGRAAGGASGNLCTVGESAPVDRGYEVQRRRVRFHFLGFGRGCCESRK